MYVQNWRYDFYIAIVLSFILYLIIRFFTYDSPRTYIDNKDEKNVKKILRGIAKFNGIEKEFLAKYESEEYQKLIKEIMGDKDGTELVELINNGDNSNKDKLINTEIESKSKLERKLSFFASVKYPSLRYKFLILCILWFGTRLISNCIALYSKALPGNYYFNIIVLFSFESLAYYVSGVLINISSLGRKGTLYLEYFIITIGFVLLSFFKFPLSVELTLNFII